MEENGPIQTEPTPAADTTSARALPVWLSIGLCAAVLAIWLIDFHLDVKDRDAFSWMDPYQYYTMATGLASGELGFEQFQLPTLFPVAALTLMTIDASIPSALWMNGLFAIVLTLATVALCRELRLKTTPAVAVLAVLCSPLLIGLSRELYLEFTLAALVALQYAAWFRTREFTRPGWVVVFAALFGIGLMWKMTWPVFFAAPALIQATMLLIRRQPAALGMMIAAFLVPTALVVWIQMTVFETTLEYYRTLGNTSIPIMYLIGPPEVGQPSSIVYYFVQLGRTGLFLATPLIVLAFIGLKNLRQRMNDESARQQIILWLWLLSPLFVLIFTAVKEPRHIAPCVLPAVILILIGIEHLPMRGSRLALVGMVALSTGSYLTVTLRLLPFPYFLDRPLKLDAIVSAMLRHDPEMPADLLQQINVSADQHILLRRWCHAQNIAISGFEPNEALAIAWRLRPAAVFDLDLYGSSDVLEDDRPYRQYDDLFTLAAFNLYNRRCGWEYYLDTLTRPEVLSQADYVLLKNVPEDYTAVAYAPFARVAPITIADNEIQVLRRREEGTVPYRVLYALKYAARNTSLTDSERDVLFLDLYKSTQSRNPSVSREAILQFRVANGQLVFPPTYNPSNPDRNIRFYSFYDALYGLYDLLAQQTNQPPR